MTHAGGRPIEYNEETLLKAKEYIASCKDVEEDKENKIAKKVKLPSIGGLAVAVGAARSTLYEWAKKYPEFSDIMETMLSIQEERLLNNGLSGAYNPTISKVILTKHGYREGIDQTTNDKDLPSPILGNEISINHLNKKDSEASETN